jgi:hypothetical protein
MKVHWHASVEDIVIYGVSAILVINVTRFAAAKLAKMDGPTGTFGQALGALVHFGA